MAGGAGLAAMYHPKRGDQVSTIGAIGYYTQMRQAYFAAQTEWYFDEGGRQLGGTGPDTPASAEETCTPRSVEVRLVHRWLWKPSLSVGPSYRLLLTDMNEVEQGGLLDAGDVEGGGFELVWDDRDDQLWATKGTYATASLAAYPPWMGSSSLHSSGKLDARHYWEVLPRTVLGLQGLLDMSAGEVPFQVMPRLGGSGTPLHRQESDCSSDRTTVSAVLAIWWRGFWRCCQGRANHGR